MYPKSLFRDFYTGPKSLEPMGNLIIFLFLFTG
jgi:hypothetical protein